MNDLPDNMFKCEKCGGVFERVCSDDDLQAEYEQVFPNEDRRRCKSFAACIVRRLINLWRQRYGSN